MILNSGLDNACTNDADRVTSPSTTTAPYFTKFIRYACFGTGSTAPAAGDTSLVSQVGSRTNNNGGFSDSDDYGSDAGTDTLWYEGTFTRTFSIGSNVNATEWGLSPAATGNLSVRELFRADPLDNNSSPITLTLESGDQLQLVITFRVQADWKYVTKSFVITGTPGNDTNGTHEGKTALAYGTGVGGITPRDALSCAWPGGGSSINHNKFWRSSSDQTSIALDANQTNVADDISSVADTYTPGDYYRDWVGSWSTAQANGDHYAWFVGQADFGVGYRFILTDPAKLTKVSTHKLTLTFRRTISRL